MSARAATLEMVLIGTPTSMTAFIQAVAPAGSANAAAVIPATLYGSKELMAANPLTQGLPTCTPASCTTSLSELSSLSVRQIRPRLSMAGPLNLPSVH